MMSRPHTKNARLFFLSCILSALVYFYFLQSVQRYEHLKLSLCAALLFAAYYYILKTLNNNTLILGAGLFFRLVLLLSIPNLSQDFYRFIWDGRMIFEGFNPYMSLPETYIKQGIQPIKEAFQLYNGMGELNGSHYTNYPPINQLCFLIAALFASIKVQIQLHIVDLQVQQLFFTIKNLSYHSFWTLPQTLFWEGPNNIYNPIRTVQLAQ